MFVGVFRKQLMAIAACMIACLAAMSIFAQEPTPWSSEVSPLPAPTGPVNDYAGVIDEETKAAVNKRLIEFQRTSGVELAVAVVKTTGERPIFDYSLAVARGWGIGAKEDDNPSALLLIAVEDRKYFTQVSRNLQDELPDGLVGSLQRQYLVPEFKKANYAKGIADTIEAYIRTYEQRSSGTAASPTPVPGRDGSRTQQGAFSTFCCLIVIGVILLIIFSKRGGGSGRGGSSWGGGGFGGSGGALPWIIGSAIANAASSSSSSSGWGGSSGGSDWGGGGGGWGGFGGGGDFDGGGAGGDW